MEDFIAHFFPSKVLKSQKRYLRRGLYKPCDRNIREFICRIDEMVEYLEKFLPFGTGQHLPDDEILMLV